MHPCLLLSLSLLAFDRPTSSTCASSRDMVPWIHWTLKTWSNIAEQNLFGSVLLKTSQKQNSWRINHSELNENLPLLLPEDFISMRLHLREATSPGTKKSTRQQRPKQTGRRHLSDDRGFNYEADLSFSLSCGEDKFTGVGRPIKKAESTPKWSFSASQLYEPFFRSLVFLLKTDL